MDDMKEDEKPYTIVKQDSASIELKQNQNDLIVHNLMINDSPEKHNFLSPEKTGIKGSDIIEENTVSKLFLDQPIDIEAKGVDDEDRKETEEEVKEITANVDKD